MSNLTQYFVKREVYKPKYHLGDRVSGRWNKIPFMASVLHEINGQVMVQIDLPFKFENVEQNILTVPVKDVKILNIEI